MIQNVNANLFSRMLVVLMLITASFTFQSCGPKLPSGVTDIVGKLGTDVPKLFNAAKNVFNPKYAAEFQKLLGMVSDAQGMLGDSKIPGISDMFGDLASKNLQPFEDLWKSKGKLSPDEIKSGVDGFNDALGAIKKAGKMK